MKRFRFLVFAFVLSWPSLAQAQPKFEVGEGVVNISPPKGTALGGYNYRDPAKPRVATGVDFPPEARALVLRHGEVTLAILSLDMLNMSFDMTERVQQAVEKQWKIPAKNVRVCATHAHTMPSIAFNRHWGDNNPAYEASVEKALVRAVGIGLKDCSPADMRVGAVSVPKASRNRTLGKDEKAKTEAEFSATSTDDDRWHDTILRVLVFERTDKATILWYHFSAHPTALGGSSIASAEWPGMVQRLVRAKLKVSPSFLQGHIGDIAPAPPAEISNLIADAIEKAITSAKKLPVDGLRVETQSVRLPFDLAVFRQQIARIKPAVETGKASLFDKDWYETFASNYDMNKTHLRITLAAVRIGPVGMLFHPAELYTYYGLAIQRGSPYGQTLVVGYADGYVGYVADPRAYKRSEYAAVKVPTILNFPQFAPNAGAVMTEAAIELLKKVR